MKQTDEQRLQPHVLVVDDDMIVRGFARIRGVGSRKRSLGVTSG